MGGSPTRVHLALGLSQLGSYSALYYTWPIVAVPMAAELGWNDSLVAAGFSGGLLVAGVVAPAVGRRIDSGGPRTPMIVGAGLAILGLVLWSISESLKSYLAIQLLLGVAAATTQYDAVFAGLGWIDRNDVRRTSGIMRVTLLGSLAGPLAVALAGPAVSLLGWRRALRGMAGVFVVLTLVPLLLTLPPGRRFPPRAERAERAERAARAERGSTDGGSGVRRTSSRLLAMDRVGLAFGLGTLVSAAVHAHLVTWTLASEGDWALATTALAVATGSKLPARLMLWPLASRLGGGAGVALTFLGQGVGVVLLCTPVATAGWWLGVVLVGSTDALLTPLRALLGRGLVDASVYGRWVGRTATWTACGKAAGPLIGSLLGTALASVGASVVVLGGLSVLAARITLTTRSGARPQPDSAESG